MGQGQCSSLEMGKTTLTCSTCSGLGEGSGHVLSQPQGSNGDSGRAVEKMSGYLG